jgi:hypothetical protein
METLQDQLHPLPWNAPKGVKEKPHVRKVFVYRKRKPKPKRQTRYKSHDRANKSASRNCGCPVNNTAYHQG